MITVTDVRRIVDTEAVFNRFRWVSLQLDFLRGLKYEPAVRSRLQQLPTKLLHLYDETYSQTLESRAEEEQLLIQNALRMLLCLHTPLRTGDFMLALCSCEEASLSAEDLLDLCSNFVVLDTELDIFRFAHLSVREFLETKDDYAPARNHALIAELSLRYLSSDIVRQSTEYWINQPFGSELGPQQNVLLIHKHPSKAPAAEKFTEYTMPCASCEKHQDAFWSCRMPDRSGVYYCEECVEGGRLCKYEDRCPLVTTLVYGRTNTPMINESLDDENEEVDADTRISTISTVPIFLDGFHLYSCGYWPFHLSQSMDLRLSTRLQTVSLDFMLGGQQTASASFVTWNNAIHISQRDNFQVNTWGYSTDLYEKVVCGVSQPADCIFIAAVWEFCDILELRLRNSPETVNNVCRLTGSPAFGSPALLLASVYGNIKAVQILLENGARLEATNCDGNTALMAAVISRQLEVARLLLESGADARTKQGKCYPLQQAVRTGHLGVVQLLLKYGAAPESEAMIDDPVLSETAAKGNEEAMQLILDSLTTTDSSTKLLWEKVTRIQKVMRIEGEAGLSQLLSTWPRSTVASKFLGTVLWDAVEREDEACARLLLANGADTDTMFEKRSVFDVAVRRFLKYGGGASELKFVKMLLDHGAKPNIRRYSKANLERLLGSGTEFGLTDLVNLCADSGADLNAPQFLCGVPLLRALETRNVEMVRLLLERGSDPKAVSDEFFSGNLECRDTGQHSLQYSEEEAGKLLSAYGATR